MNPTQSSEPLTDAEIRERLERLNGSALMTRIEPSTALAFTDDFKLNDNPTLEAFAAEHGIDDEKRYVIENLALSLVAARMNEAEFFRLGTSDEAMKLFESKSREWRRCRELRGNVVPFRKVAARV